MTDSAWPQGLRDERTAPTFDLESAAPEVWAALRRASPAVAPALDRLRRGIFLMPSSESGAVGPFYRLPQHNRSVCWALSGDPATSEVVVLKGSEPLLADFDAYLAWMRRRIFGGVRPVTEHFPLAEGKAPGCTFLSEAVDEARIALDLQSRHLRHYGELARLPTPLLVHRFSDERARQTITSLRAALSTAAFDRVEPHLERGLAALVYHYPSPPLRVHAVGQPSLLPPGMQPLSRREHVLTTALPRWVQLFSRLLCLGYLPLTPLGFRLGALFDVNNACLDGGGCDVGTIMPMHQAPDAGFFARSMFFSLGVFRQTVAHALGLPIGEIPADFRQAIIASNVEQVLLRLVERALETEARPDLPLDSRLDDFRGPKTMFDVLRLLQTMESSFSSADYCSPAPHRV